MRFAAIPLAIFVCAIAQAQPADWELLSETDDIKNYWSPATVKNSGGRVRVWTLQDLQEPKTQLGLQNLHSVLAQLELDCKSERFRFLFTSFHATPMARGRTIDINGPEQDWETAVPPGSTLALLFKKLC